MDDRPDLLHPLLALLKGKDKITKSLMTEDDQSAVLEIHTVSRIFCFYVEPNSKIEHWQGYFHIAPLEGPLPKASKFK